MAVWPPSISRRPLLPPEPPPLPVTGGSIYSVPVTRNHERECGLSGLRCATARVAEVRPRLFAISERARRGGRCRLPEGEGGKPPTGGGRSGPGAPPRRVHRRARRLAKLAGSPRTPDFSSPFATGGVASSTARGTCPKANDLTGGRLMALVSPQEAPPRPSLGITPPSGICVTVLVYAELQARGWRPPRFSGCHLIKPQALPREHGGSLSSGRRVPTSPRHGPTPAQGKTQARTRGDPGPLRVMEAMSVIVRVSDLFARRRLEDFNPPRVIAEASDLNPLAGLASAP